MSLTELLQKTDEEIGKAATEVERGAQGAEGRLAQAETRHGDLLARRDRRRQELQQQRSLTLQAVERITTVLVLPHPERNSPEVRRLKPNPETEAIAMRVVIEYERSQGRQVYDVHEKNLGYDVTSLDLNSGELRLIEVKGIGDSEGMVVLTPHEYEVAEDRRDCYWLYVVTDCNTSPKLTMIRDPAVAAVAAREESPALHARFIQAAKGGPIRRSSYMAVSKRKKRYRRSRRVPPDAKRLSAMVGEGEGPALEFKRSTGELKEAMHDPFRLPQRRRRHGPVRRQAGWPHRGPAGLGPDAPRRCPSWSAVRAARRPHATADPHRRRPRGACGDGRNPPGYRPVRL